MRLVIVLLWFATMVCVDAEMYASATSLGIGTIVMAIAVARDQVLDAIRKK